MTDRTVPRDELLLCTDPARRIALERRTLVIGRAADCDVVVRDEGVSRRHCRLLPGSAGGWSVEDLGSRAGTLVDGRPVQGTAPLAHGSWLRLGATAIQLVRDGEPALVPSGEPARDAFLMGELFQAMQGFAAAEGPDDVLRTIVDRGVRVAGGDRGALFLAGEDGRLEVALARDRERGDLPLDSVLTRTLPARALRLGRPVVVADADRADGDEIVPPSLGAAGRRSVVCVPLPGADGPRGVLYVDSSRPARAVRTAELAVLAVLATQASLAVDRAEDAQRSRAERDRLREENLALRSRAGAAPAGESAPLLAALELTRRLASSSATVCLIGETGTGKEVLARYLHSLSPRAGGPFVVVDCGALPESLVESELFGHERGAFTGAVQARPGRIREAEGGTVFLDEIGEVPLALQPRLLRFLQDRVVHPVGGRPQPVDARVVCATHRDLGRMVASGAFREDLYYRLAVLTIEVPALRDRGDDVLLLARHLLVKLQEGAAARVRDFTREAQDALLRHPWPGNVRELEHRVHRTVLLADSAFVTSRDLGLGPEGPPAPEEAEAELLPLPEARSRAGERFERAYLERALGRAGGSVSRAAALAGVSRQAIHALLKRHGVDPERFGRRR